MWKASCNCYSKTRTYCPTQAASPCVHHQSVVICHPSSIINQSGRGVSPCVHQCYVYEFSSVFLVYVSVNWVLTARLIDRITTLYREWFRDNGWRGTNNYIMNGKWSTEAWRQPSLFLWHNIFDGWWMTDDGQWMTDTWRCSLQAVMRTGFDVECQALDHKLSQQL